MMPEEGKNSRNGIQDAELNAALRNFRQSVHAWSEAAYNRPRIVATVTHASVWRMAVSWATGCVLVLGVASGVVYQHERVAEQARQAKIAAQQDQQRRATAPKSAEDADALLARVDSDISRQVPAAMDPLAGLVDEEGSKQP